ncbi:hypothetical protein IJD15_05625 [bacterium]|nr:hypothetical protein [bacterium]
MNISSPTFGKKLPIIRSQVQDKETGKFESVTVYKVDCADDSDVQEIRDLDDSWRFKNLIAKDMARKNHLIKYFEQDNEQSIYVVQDDKQQILGIGEMEEVDDAVYNVNYLESNGKKKFVGQILLASMGDEVLVKNGKKLTVSDPEENAYNFYTDVCGFEDYYGYFLRMNPAQINQFIEQTEDRTKSIFLDIRG